MLIKDGPPVSHTLHVGHAELSVMRQLFAAVVTDVHDRPCTASSDIVRDLDPDYFARVRDALVAHGSEAGET